MKRRATACVERDSNNLAKLSPKSSDSTGLYVISLNQNSPAITVDWLLDLLRSSNDGRPKLELRRVESFGENCPNYDELKKTAVGKRGKSRPDCEEILIEVNATVDRLEEAARRLELKILSEEKLPKDGSNLDSVLSYSEKQRLLLNELECGEGLHCHEKTVLFGFPNIKMYAGQSILQACRREEVITQYFPLHDNQELEKLKKSWCYSLRTQPLEAIRRYFGESIAFYFAFLEFYTLALIFPTLVGIYDFVFTGNQINPFAVLFYAVWTAIFLKRWKRRSNQLAFEWDTLEVINFERPRPSFRGKSMGVDPVTGKEIPIYPIMKTWTKEYLMSLPIIFACLFVAFKVMMFYFEVEAAVIEYYALEEFSLVGSVAIHLPGVVYAILVTVMNTYYRKLANRLNDWENHRTQTSHESHLIIKLVLFEFANNFMSIFYVAFVQQNIVSLRWQIGTMLIVYQIVDNVQEVILPLFSNYLVRRSLAAQEKKFDVPESVAKVIRESKMPVYEDTYYDYLELFIQFGYVFLFASVFPLAPLLALINNVLEVRSDAFKLCSAYQRPHQRPARGINGAWLKAFEVMGVISVISNCSLLVIDNLAGSAYHNLEMILLAVSIEHVILAVVLVIGYVVPDMPRDVHVKLLKKHYERSPRLQNLS